MFNDYIDWIKKVTSPAFFIPWYLDTFCEVKGDNFANRPFRLGLLVSGLLLLSFLITAIPLAIVLKVVSIYGFFWGLMLTWLFIFAGNYLRERIVKPWSVQYMIKADPYIQEWVIKKIKEIDARNEAIAQTLGEQKAE